MGFWHIIPYAVLSITPLLSTIIPIQHRGNSETLAVINDSHIITLSEVDALIKNELYELRKEIYDLRKTALDNMITKILLEDESLRRAVPVDDLKREYMAMTEDIPIAEIEKLYRENAAVLAGFDESEAKVRIRLDLETNARLRRYRSALTELRDSADIRVFLQEPVAPLVDVDESGPRLGPQDAPVTIIVFSDFLCPFCKKTVATLRRLVDLYGNKIALVFKHSPLPGRPRAFQAARASFCAFEQGKFWEYHDRLFKAADLSDAGLEEIASSLQIEIKKFADCLRSSASSEAVLKDLGEARRIGVQGTPYFVVNGHVIKGAQDLSAFRKIIDKSLNRFDR